MPGSPVTIADAVVHNEEAVAVSHIWISGDLKGGKLYVRTKPTGVGTGVYVAELIEDQNGPIRAPGHFVLSLPASVDIQFQVIGATGDAPDILIHYA